MRPAIRITAGLLLCLALAGLSSGASRPDAPPGSPGRYEDSDTRTGLTAAVGATPSPEFLPPGRRNLFQPPTGVTTAARPLPTGAPVAPTMPPIPDAPGAALPLPPSPLPVPTGPPAPSEEPLALVAVILGPSPQVILHAATRYAIARVGEETPWGRVAVITRTGVVLATGSGTTTLHLPGGVR